MEQEKLYKFYPGPKNLFTKVFTGRKLSYTPIRF